MDHIITRGIMGVACLAFVGFIFYAFGAPARKFKESKSNYVFYTKDEVSYSFKIFEVSANGYSIIYDEYNNDNSIDLNEVGYTLNYERLARVYDRIENSDNVERDLENALLNEYGKDFHSFEVIKSE